MTPPAPAPASPVQPTSTLDIGLSSRALKDDETERWTGTTIALDGIAIIVNNDNTVEDLTARSDQAASPPARSPTGARLAATTREIVLVGREAGSGTRDGFESIVGVEDACVYDQELTSHRRCASRPWRPTPTPSATLPCPLSDDTVKAVTVDGVECQRGHRAGRHLQDPAPVRLRHQRGR